MRLSPSTSVFSFLCVRVSLAVHNVQSLHRIYKTDTFFSLHSSPFCFLSFCYLLPPPSLVVCLLLFVSRPFFLSPFSPFPSPPFFFYPPFRWSPPDCSLVRRVAHPGRLPNRSRFQRTGMVVLYTTRLVRPGGQLPRSHGIIDHPLKGVSTNKFCRIAGSFRG